MNETALQNPLTNLSEFTRAYIVAALWTFDEDAPSGEYEDSGRIEELAPRIHPDSLASMTQEAGEFHSLNGHLWKDHYSDDRAGHDFWLTRNGHGAGFWDRDELPDEIGKQLTDAAHKCGERYLYYGDDGKIYCE